MIILKRPVRMLAFFLCSLTFFHPTMAQERSILETDDTWGKEIIEFPIEWAPEMNVQGFEELRFAPEWNKPDSDQFWSLVIAWKVQAEKPLTLLEIEQNMEAYFSGLMKPNYWATTFSEPNVLFLTTGVSAKGTSFKGKMKFFDGLHTGKLVAVNVDGDQFYDASLKSSMVVFYISPKNLGHPIWKDLKTIKPSIKS